MSDNENLATELLREVKASAKRWFIIALVELMLILIGSIVFVWYISLPIDEYNVQYSQEANDNELSDVQQTIGGHEDGKSEANSP